MKISEKFWKRYINKLRLIDKRAATLMKTYIDKYGLKDNKRLIDYAYALSSYYGEAAAAYTAQLYDDLAVLSGAKRIPTAVVAETASYEEVAKAVNGTLKTGNENIISNAVGVLVKRAGADTMLKNAIRDKVEFAWIPAGDTCAYCLALASNGWQKASKDALKNGHAEHIHANCDCTYMIRFNKDTTVSGYDPDKYLKEYKNAEGNSFNDKVNYIRRQYYAENKDKINEQKRIAYAARKEREENEG